MDAQIIPADTDFRMFSYRYFGSLPGIDVALLLDSSAYHTHEDAPHRIRPGTLQVNPIRYPFPYLYFVRRRFALMKTPRIAFDQAQYR